MKERLKELMGLLAVNAADLADKIGVQRSSISHILSGRNLPSTQFIEKLLNTYTEIDARWLITGTGKPFRAMEVTKPEVTKPEVTKPEVITEKAPVEKVKQKEIKWQDENSLSDSPDRIEKVILFYRDRSFKEFNPGK
jgi:transcriptional regulator with XRE-family HTH domain